jgi:hypothetical protein
MFDKLVAEPFPLLWGGRHPMIHVDHAGRPGRQSTIPRPMLDDVKAHFGAQSLGTMKVDWVQTRVVDDHGCTS